MREENGRVERDLKEERETEERKGEGEKGEGEKEDREKEAERRRRAGILDITNLDTFFRREFCGSIRGFSVSKIIISPKQINDKKN